MGRPPGPSSPLAPAGTTAMPGLIPDLISGIPWPLWALILVALAASALIVSCLLCAFCCCRRRHKNQPRDKEAVGLGSARSSTTTHLVQPDVDRLQGDPEDPRQWGRLQLSLEYDLGREEVKVGLKQAADLRAGGTADPYARASVSTQPGHGHETKVHRGTLCPVFEETCCFHVSLGGRRWPGPGGRLDSQPSAGPAGRAASDHPARAAAGLQALLGAPAPGGAPLAAGSGGPAACAGTLVPAGPAGSPGGEAQGGSSAGRLPPARPIPQRKPSGCPQPEQTGELCFSLRYVPSSGRLTVVVLEARGLSPGLAEPYVKVQLMVNQRKWRKRKTSARRGTASPYFNEAFTFLVPFSQIQSVDLVLAVWAHGLRFRAEPVGKVLLGSRASGQPLQHWADMLAHARRPIAQWHRLRPAMEVDSTLALRPRLHLPLPGS
nr:synaptotagmin-8 isoform X3 [Ictidomys tridecemlineatus]XP_040139879.1 synaptotagmin-8 isoform X3 [Ictidomys tridecemlineatus]